MFPGESGQYGATGEGASDKTSLRSLTLSSKHFTRIRGAFSEHSFIIPLNIPWSHHDLDLGGRYQSLPIASSEVAGSVAVRSKFRRRQFVRPGCVVDVTLGYRFLVA